MQISWCYFTYWKNITLVSMVCLRLTLCRLDVDSTNSQKTSSGGHIKYSFCVWQLRRGCASEVYIHEEEYFKFVFLTNHLNDSWSFNYTYPHFPLSNHKCKNANHYELIKKSTTETAHFFSPTQGSQFTKSKCWQISWPHITFYRSGEEWHH